MSLRARHLIYTLLPTAFAVFSAAPAFAYDYPTAERVIYVEQCVQENPGPHYEMITKCSCALDQMAKTTSHDDFVSMETAVNASTIGGERGNAVRDAQGIQDLAKAFRDLQASAKKSCFIGTMSPVR